MFVVKACKKYAYNEMFEKCLRLGFLLPRPSVNFIVV